MSAPPLAAELRERAAALGPYLGNRLGRQFTVARAWLAGEGMSDATIVLEPERGSSVVLRADTSVLGEGGAAALRRQFLLLRALEPTAVPAPHALFCEPDPAVLGAAFLATRRLPGHAVVPWSRAGSEELAELGSGRAGEQLFTVLAAVHALGERTPGLGEALGAPPPQGPARRALARLHEAVGEFEGEPVFADALGWLRAHLPADEPVGLVHGDYRPGNMLFAGGAVSGLLDWEFAHFGSPLQDLAWLLAESNRVDPELAAGMVPAAGAVERYEAASGRAVDPAALGFWRVCVVMENAAHWLRTTRAWRAGGVADLRIARWSFALPRLREMVLGVLGERL